MSATLTRTVLGRQAAYARYSDLTAGNRGLDPFDSQDWEAITANDVYETTVAELRGTLRMTSLATGATSAYAIESGVTNVSDAYMQMEIAEMESSANPASYTPLTGDFRAGLALRGSAPVANTFPTDGIFVVVPGPTSTNSSPSNRATIRERVNSVDVQTINTASDTRGTTANRRIHAVLSNTTIDANNGGVGTSWSLSATGLTAGAGRPGMVVFGFGSARYLFVAQYYRCIGKDLTVNGPTLGTWYVRLLDKDNNVLVTSSAQSGGQVVIDYQVAGLLLPQTQKIQIYDGVSALVTVYPDNGVWPGDTWVYADDPTPSGVVTRTAAGLVMARLSPYITTGLSISAHATANWIGWAQNGATNLSSILLVTSTSSAYQGELNIATSFSGTTSQYLRRGARWVGAESIPSDAFFVGTMRVATNNTAASYAGAYLRSGTAPQTARVGGILGNQNASPKEHQLEEVSAGTVVQTSVESGEMQINRRARIGLWVRGTLATLRAILFRQISGPSVVVENLTGLVAPPPTAGMAVLFGSTSSGLSQFWQGMSVMTSAEITMSGPTQGVAVWGLRVRDASGQVVLESGPNVGGVATINTQTDMDIAYGRYAISVMRSVEAYDTATGDALSDRLTPAGGVWGGDTFTVASLPPANSYPESRLVHRKAGAQRLLLKR